MTNIQQLNGQKNESAGTYYGPQTNEYPSGVRPVIEEKKETTEAPAVEEPTTETPDKA